LSQEAGLVPIVEPEVLIDGDHTLEKCYEVEQEVLCSVFNHLYLQRVDFEWTILKTSMVLPGKYSPKQNSIEEVADATVKCLLKTVPPAIPGVAFLSGGQSCELAAARLNAMNVRFALKLPWVLTFSYSRAIQQPALEYWKGKDENAVEAQRILYHRARCNSAARNGQYTAEMEKELEPVGALK
jgi:fructose-bisphosphate aldolase class I